MVKYVVFVRLDDEEDAKGERGVGFGGAIGFVSAGEPEGEGGDGRICGERGGRYGRSDCRWVGVHGEEVPMVWLEMGPVDLVKADLCKEETLDDRPPKDDAIVLNSTCLISRPASGSEGSR